jgi:hypothetical protein
MSELLIVRGACACEDPSNAIKVAAARIARLAGQAKACEGMPVVIGSLLLLFDDAMMRP